MPHGTPWETLHTFKGSTPEQETAGQLQQIRGTATHTGSRREPLNADNLINII